MLCPVWELESDLLIPSDLTNAKHNYLRSHTRVALKFSSDTLGEPHTGSSIEKGGGSCDVSIALSSVRGGGIAFMLSLTVADKSKRDC